MKIKQFTINKEGDMPVNVQYDDYDITIIDVNHKDNSITLTWTEFYEIVEALKHEKTS